MGKLTYENAKQIHVHVKRNICIGHLGVLLLYNPTNTFLNFVVFFFHPMKQKPGIHLCLQAITVPDLQQRCL